MSFRDNINNAIKVFKGDAKIATKKTRRALKDSIEVQIYRFNSSIDSWKGAISEFEDVHFPINESLIAEYQDAEVDAHLSALIEVRKNKLCSKDFKIVNEENEEDIESTKILQSDWFMQCLKAYSSSIFYGHTLINLGDRIDKSFDGVDIVPREYVNGHNKVIRTTPRHNTGKSYVGTDLDPWTVEIGNPKDMGLMYKAVPLTIFKKSALQSWAEFAEVFGSPLRIGRTDVNDDELLDNMYNMLAEMGSSSYGVFNKEDSVELIESSGTDAFNVFNEKIKTVNSELSKLVLSSTMVIDDGSSRSQSEVHERIVDNISKTDCVGFSFWVNNVLIPKLIKYHGFTEFKGKTFMFDDKEVISLKDQFERDIKLLDKYDIPVEYMSEKYGVPLDEKPEPVTPIKGSNDSKPGDIDNMIKAHAGGGGMGKYIASSCECITNVENMEDPPSLLSDDELNALYEGIYSGTVSVEALPISLYTSTAEAITDKIAEGIDEAVKLSFGSIPDDDYIRALTNNAFRFSGAKTFQQVRIMSDFILDENGKERTFKQFREKAEETFKEFNVNYLRTEINHAKSSSQMASKHVAIVEDIEDFPYLKYITQGDAVVRQQHKRLDDIVRRADDLEFWGKFYPPNDWNCRCDVIRLSTAEVSDISNLTDEDNPPEGFDTNVGINRQLFSPEHPYFIVESQFEGLARNNFNLPLDGDT